jgi:hypothetical protein
MQPRAFRITGTKESLEQLRNELMAMREATDVVIEDVLARSDDNPAKNERLRGAVDFNAAIFAFMIHVPAGVTAHIVYDWVRGWLNARAAMGKVHMEEVLPSGLDKTKNR